MGKLEEAVEAYLYEWMKGLPPKDADVDWYRESLGKTHVMPDDTKYSWQILTFEGNRLLWSAADALLQRTEEQLRVDRETARRCLIDAHVAHIPKARRQGRLSEHAISGRAITNIAEVPRATGKYVFPICFAPSAKSTKFRIGPAEILSKSNFEIQYGEMLNRKSSDFPAFGKSASAEWEIYSKRYDHFVVVDVAQHQRQMAWKTARDVTEYTLNLVRMKFGFYHTDDIRVGNGFVWETSRASVYFDDNDDARFEISRGPWGSHLKDDWEEFFDDDFGSEAEMLASLGYWMASGSDPTSPVLERIRYANTLIAEAYSEPHDRIRLVRLVAGLEALAALPGGEKAHSLAVRCALAGGWGDTGRASEIIEDVRYAYSVRNQIVHGDSPLDRDAVTAFHRLEEHLARTYLGFLSFYAKVHRRYRPSHIHQVRRAFAERIEYFFWDPDHDW